MNALRLFADIFGGKRIMRHKSFTTILAIVMMAVGLFSGSAMAG
jgi:hypothetical protein